MIKKPSTQVLILAVVVLGLIIVLTSTQAVQHFFIQIFTGSSFTPNAPQPAIQPAMTATVEYSLDNIAWVNTVPGTYKYGTPLYVRLNIASMTGLTSKTAVVNFAVLKGAGNPPVHTITLTDIVLTGSSQIITCTDNLSPDITTTDTYNVAVSVIVE